MASAAPAAGAQRSSKCRANLGRARAGLPRARHRRYAAIGMLKLAPFLLGLSLASQACSGGYPLEPTPCDDLCNATEGSLYYCSRYDPAGCVAQCEAQGLSGPPCRSQREALLACFHDQPHAISEQCSSAPNLGGCRYTVDALLQCVAVQTDFPPP